MNVASICRFIMSRWSLFVAILALLAGVSFLVLRSVIEPRGEVDFRFFWLAGHLWAGGLDPYSDRFREIGATMLPPGNVVLYWFYPPQWWIVSRGMALFDLERAVMIWRLLNGALILLGTALVTASVKDDVRRRWTAMAFWGGVALLIEPTANLLAFGQSAGFVYMSLALLVAGVLRRRPWLVGLAVFLATFKPQVGLMVLFWALLVPSFRGAALAGLGGAGLLTLPHIMQAGISEAVRAYLSNAAKWADMPSNAPVASSGPAGLLTRLGAGNADLIWQILAAAAVTVCAAWMIRRQPFRPVAPLLLLTTAIACLMPLHIYDLTVLLIPLILLTLGTASPAWLPWVTLLLMARPGKIEMLLGVPQYSSDVSAGLIGLGVAGLLLFAFAIREALRGVAPLSQGDEPRETLALESSRFG